MKKETVLLFYLNNLTSFYYFYLIPTIIAFVIVSFDFSFNGLFPSTVASLISSKHKFLNDYFAICSFSVIALIFINYFRYPLTNRYIRKTYPSMDSWVWVMFFCFMLGGMNSIWFFTIDKPLPSYKQWHKGDIFVYLSGFAHPYISTVVYSLQYTLIVMLALSLTNALNTRKYKI